MCTTCGCGQETVGTGPKAPLDGSPTGPHVEQRGRLVQVEQDLLAKNDRLAQVNRARLAQAGTFAVNLMSGPGSGKTTLLVRSLAALRGHMPLAVVEGDQQTSLDAERIRATGVPALQINTGKGCHLDASMIGRALDVLPPPHHGVLFIENVGNLVCPAGFDLGEAKKVVVVSVTEGEDKPLKYPDMFAAADLVLVNKVDLLPHLAFDVALLETNLRRVAPKVEIRRLSATTGEGMAAWLAWLADGVATTGADPRHAHAHVHPHTHADGHVHAHDPAVPAGEPHAHVHGHGHAHASDHAHDHAHGHDHAHDHAGGHGHR